jgi:hypothetical protein
MADLTGTEALYAADGSDFPQKKKKKSYATTYYRRHRDTILAKAQQKYATGQIKSHTKYSRGDYLKRIHCISVSQYLELFRKQSGCCAICGVSHLELTRGLFVDHDHQTKKVRGLLCGNCNLALGAFKDSPEILNDAVNYLKSYFDRF